MESVPLVVPRTCFDCDHFAEVMTREGIYSRCEMFAESIHSESVAAEDCEAYEVTP